MNTAYRGFLSTPIGHIEVAVDRRGAVTSVAFRDNPAVASCEDAGPCADVVRQLEEYFLGTRRSFDLELAADGTDFEHRVWDEVWRIPYGATDTYGEIARRLSDPSAAQAVGTANARNPIAIIVPCHRVIGADGDLTGYAGGLDRKRWLLSHESGQQRLDFS